MTGTRTSGYGLIRRYAQNSLPTLDMFVATLRLKFSVRPDEILVQMAVVSSCREMLVSPATSATLTLVAIIKLGTLKELPVISEEGGDDVKSSWPRWATHVCYNGIYNRKQNGDVKQILKCLSSDCTANRVHEAELLVIADQRRGEYVPGSCTHRPSHHGSCSTLARKG